jgi:hypothetical protein
MSHDEKVQELINQTNQEQLKELIADFQVAAMRLGYSTLTVCINSEGTQIDTSGSTQNVEDFMAVRYYETAMQEFTKLYNNQNNG